MFNLDEVGDSPGKDVNGKLSCRRLIPRKGIQDYKCSDFSYEKRITMMPVINAAGDCGPPLFVVKGKRVQCRQELRNGRVLSETPLSLLPRTSVLANRAKGGGVDRENFLFWAWTFIDYSKDLRASNRKVLLIYDGYRSHLSLEVLDLFMENSVVVYALHAHTSEKTQPLDTVLFAAFKNALNTAVNSCSGFTDGRCIDIFYLCSILRHGYEASFTRSNVKAGFRRAGLWPVDASRLLNTPRPESRSHDAPIMSLESLERSFEEKQVELRNQILGTDAKMLECGYVDTSNGCVMTSSTLLELMRKKQGEQRKMKEAERLAELSRSMKAAQRRTKALLEIKKMREAQTKCRAHMAGMEVKEF